MIRSTCRIALTLGLIGTSAIWFAFGLGLIPDSNENIVEARVKTCESLALTTSELVESNNLLAIQRIVSRIQERRSDISSIRVSRHNATVALAGKHPVDWVADDSSKSTTERMSIHIMSEGNAWGNVQVKFEPLPASIFSSILLIGFTGPLIALCSWFFLHRTLQYLNPTKVVPNRVKNALDVLTEGVVLQDSDGLIVMANQGFIRIVGKGLDELMGGTPDKFYWKRIRDEVVQESNVEDSNLGDLLPDERAPLSDEAVVFPWHHALESHASAGGVMLGLQDREGVDRKFVVNSTPLMEENGNCRGTITSFQDVSALEDKRSELSRMLTVLKKSRDEIRRQNEELHFLASRDPMTGCFNRRFFYDNIDKYWEETTTGTMSVIMLDIDHFKSINDNFGHGVGDIVIKGVAKLCMDTVGDRGQVCRYGGEEFCIAMPHVDYHEAIAVGELLRQSIENTTMSDVNLTISVGVTERRFLAMDVQHMIEQADQALYGAKNGGRNQVVGWEKITQVGGQSMSDETPGSGDSQGFVNAVEHESVVEALYSALFFRNRVSAERSARIANLAIHMAQPVMDETVLSVLRVSCLLHEIGLLGISVSADNINYDRNRFQTEIFGRQQNVAEMICQSAGVSHDVLQIILGYCIPNKNGAGLRELSESRPMLALCCKILAVCEAFDSLAFPVNRRAPQEVTEACNNLAKLCPDAYDPEIVELLRFTLMQNPKAHEPLEILRVACDGGLANDTVEIEAGVEAGNREPLRIMVRRLKREALDEGDELQSRINELEKALSQNDEEMQLIVQTTRELLDICRTNRDVREPESGGYLTELLSS